MSKKVQLAVLIGRGGRLPALYRWSQGAEANAEIKLVVSFKKDSVGIEWAQSQGLHARYWRWSEWKADGKSRVEYDQALGDLLAESGIDLVVLAGWGLLLQPAFVERFAGRLINVHPALIAAIPTEKVSLASGRLIPVFRGNHAAELALRAGVDTTGATVHYVTPEMDVGPVILQREVPILLGDTVETLSERIHEQEDIILPLATGLVSQKLLRDTEESLLKNVMIIGAGGREHAIGWAIRKSPEGGEIWFTPGNAGTARLENATNIAVSAENLPDLIDFALQKQPDLIIIGPEDPLAKGLANRLREKGLVVFGPSADGARLEASKSYAKAFMQRHKIPTAAIKTFEKPDPALDYLAMQKPPFVIKADGLAEGKGVLVTSDRAEAENFIEDSLSGQLFGASGTKLLIEEFMSGVEVSVLALCDTVSGDIRQLEPACDYKRAFDRDQGANTGGMGAYSPPGFMTTALREQIQQTILLPALRGLQTEGIDYRGILYAGLMLTNTGPKVVEFNCRFGDPETQSILPLLNSDLLAVLLATAQGQLASQPPLEWVAGASVGVVLAAAGYPGTYQKGINLNDFLKLAAATNGVYLFHAGTSQNAEGNVVSSRGRVLNLVAVGASVAEARHRVYNMLAESKINFEELRYRRDIAEREVG